MSNGDKERIDGALDQAKGNLKEKVGDLAGNEQAKTEGKLDQLKGKAKESIGDLKDKVDDLKDDKK